MHWTIERHREIYIILLLQVNGQVMLQLAIYKLKIYIGFVKDRASCRAFSGSEYLHNNNTNFDDVIIWNAYIYSISISSRKRKEFE